MDAPKMQEERLALLIDKLRRNQLTQSEEEELNAYYDSFESNTGYTHLLSEAERTTYREALFERIEGHATPQRRINSLYWRWGGVAAALMLFFMGLFYFTQRDQEVDLANLYYQPREFALLTTPDGQTIGIGPETSSTALTRGLTLTNDADDGYTHLEIDQEVWAERKGEEQFIQFDVIEGSIYQLALPDGTKVRLEPGSRLLLAPTFERDEQRRVELAGEASFDVTHDKDKPFMVQTAMQEVRVLGTAFTVVAYPEQGYEQVALYSGRVMLTHVTSNTTRMLSPQHISVLDKATDTYRITAMTADPGSYGHNWIFEEESLEHMAQKLERWFGVTIEVDEQVAKRAFTGIIPQNMSLQNILNALDATGDIHYVNQNDTIYIKSNK